MRRRRMYTTSSAERGSLYRRVSGNQSITKEKKNKRAIVDRAMAMVTETNTGRIGGRRLPRRRRSVLGFFWQRGQILVGAFERRRLDRGRVEF